VRLPSFAQVWILSALLNPAIIAGEPIVHMLVPGFTVRELSVRLPNINNLRFAPDGRLTALGYDGRVWLLRDSDGDDLEDTAELFWDKPSISVPVGMAWSTAGLYISSHGKVSLLRDTDGDGKADTEEIIASGWPATDVGSGGVDATAVTLDKEGNVYFGLLVADYSNAYRLRKRKDLKSDERAWLEARGDKGGDPDEQVSLYDLNSVRGTIQKWSPKTKQLETIATGIRVPFALTFNKAGDLFNTDQEGETWMPNGNPLDELNHVIPGRNYGFPPRHEKWLPNLVSEPPVVAFGPQHESTCGLVFNEPHAPLNVESLKRSTVKSAARYRSDNNRFNDSTVQRFNAPLSAAPAQGLFGPKWWEGDAFVAGESRGKIWRVRLVKTPHGYVGKEFLIARLSMLTLDLAISPKGDLYVCCHSGLPDWGTGPKGEGKIFKISYTDPKSPQPVIAWAAGPTEVRVAFDKPLDPSVTNSFGREGRHDPDSRDGGTPSLPPAIEFGEYVRAADRYEVLKPPYQVVKQQEAAPRGKIEILAAKLDHDNQTLVLTTEPHPQAVTYALTIPGVKGQGNKGAGETADVDYDLSGAGARYFTGLDHLQESPAREFLDLIQNKEVTFPKKYDVWFPHADAGIVAGYLGGFTNVVFSDLPPSLHDAEEYLMEFRLRLPEDASQLTFKSKIRFSGVVAGITNRIRPKLKGPAFVDEVDVRSADRWSHVLLNSTNKGFLPAVSYRRGTESLERPLPLSSLYPRWVSTNKVRFEATESKIVIVGGDFEGGRSLFFSDQLKCSTCHRLRGEGGAIGPDLSNLVSRDAASVLRDIKDPNASINPDYVAYNVSLNDGNELTGFIRAQDNASIQLIGADGKERGFRPTDVKEMRVSSVSLMPTGLVDGLKDEQMRDLLTFLLNEPPKRSAAEVEAALSAGENRKSKIENRKLEIVLVASKQDHGPGQHDYPAWQESWLRLLTPAAANVVATAAWQWPSKEQVQSADGIVFYYWNHEWNAEKFKQLDEFLARGGGLVLFHSATIGNDQAEPLAERFGLASHSSPRTKYRHTPLDLKIIAPDDNAIMHGLPRQIHFLDEPYWPLAGDTSKVEVLATTSVDGEDQPMMWTFQKGKGRVFTSILGHYTWTHDDPLFRVIALRGLAWAAGEPVGRFEGLALAGAHSQ